MIESILNLLSGFASKIIALFPSSPFRPFINDFIAPEYLSWLNWFVPVGDIIRVMAAWLVSVGLFYLYSIVARWVKLIGD